jgi:hypothetical protein
MLQIQEIFVVQEDSGKSYRTGDSRWYEPFTDDLGQLFKFLKREYGRCVSRVYQDTPDDDPDAIGWVFEKRRGYEGHVRSGSPKSYIQQVWVTHRQVKEISDGRNY